MYRDSYRILVWGEGVESAVTFCVFFGEEDGGKERGEGEEGRMEGGGGKGKASDIQAVYTTPSQYMTSKHE